MAVYATSTDVQNLALNSLALGPVPAASLTAALASASARADGYLATQFVLPLTAWGPDLTEAVAQIAAYSVMVARGYNPEAGADVSIRMRYEDAVRWLERVADGKIVPQVTDSSPAAAPGVTAGGAQVLTATQRGWTSRGVQPDRVNTPGNFRGD